MPEPLPKEAIEVRPLPRRRMGGRLYARRRGARRVRPLCRCVEDENSIIFGGTRAGRTRRILLATIHSLLAASGEA